MVQRVQHNADRLAKFCQRNSIRSLAIFGSALCGDFNSESDVDVLVQFEPGKRIGYFDLVAMQIELAEVLDTQRPIDLRTPGELSRYFRADVMDHAEVLYDSAA